MLARASGIPGWDVSRRPADVAPNPGASNFPALPTLLELMRRKRNATCELLDKPDLGASGG